MPNGSKAYRKKKQLLMELLSSIYVAQIISLHLF